VTGDLTIGSVLGLSAGLAPGPLLALVVAETLRHGVGAGIKVALAPVITDLPIILLAVYLLSGLADVAWLLGGLSLAGGVFLLAVGWQDLRKERVEITAPPAAARSLARGIATNALSPYPYLFWLTVGAPIMTRTAAVDGRAAVAFLLGFYLCLLGSKVLLAILVGRSRHLLGSRGYLLIVRLLGLVVCGFGLALLAEGVRLFRPG
jgi:threonine/homoserine/homoserine lactone efflux protein